MGKAIVRDSASAGESQQIDEETATATAAAKPINLLPTVLLSIITPWLSESVSISVSNPSREDDARQGRFL